MNTRHEQNWRRVIEEVAIKGPEFLPSAMVEKLNSDPSEVLAELTFYKFAGKMIGAKGRKVSVHGPADDVCLLVLKAAGLELVYRDELTDGVICWADGSIDDLNLNRLVPETGVLIAAFEKDFQSHFDKLRKVFRFCFVFNQSNEFIHAGTSNFARRHILMATGRN